VTGAGLPADHPSVDTVRAHLRRYGPGLRLLAPADERAAFAVGEVVQVEVDGHERFARARTANDDAPFFPAVYDTPDLARDPSAGDPVDRLAEWARRRGVAAGDPVLVDVLAVGERYGLREPGEAVTYRQRRTRDDSLADIARDVDGQ
jgi:hypothetical protein